MSDPNPEVAEVRVPARRNYVMSSLRKDGLIDWMKDMLNHSFVLDARDSYEGTMKYFENLIDEHRYAHDHKDARSRLKEYVPSVSRFITPLPMSRAFELYDTKYSISKRRFVAPTFNEIRHILNLAQVMAIGPHLQLITFDGDQTLYSDGGNFEDNEDLAMSIISLLCHGIKVAVVTAAGYGLDGSKYERRLRGLLDRFVTERLTPEQVQNFYVMGGECNYLLRCTLQPKVASSSADDGVEGEGEGEGGEGGSNPTLEAAIVPVPLEEWQGPHQHGPKPSQWPAEEIKELLDVAEKSMRESVQDLNLRAKVLRKERAIGIYPGGHEMAAQVPVGHGSKKIKREALDELVLRAMEALRGHTPRITLPFCVFNGGTDAWLDIGNKSVGVAALQAYLDIPQANCLHVGDQFLNTGNDIAARETCPCIWIINPRETGKVLQHVMRYGKVSPRTSRHNTHQHSFRQPVDPGMITAGVVPGTLASAPSSSKANGKGKGKGAAPGGERTLEGELGKLCVYTGDVV